LDEFSHPTLFLPLPLCSHTSCFSDFHTVPGRRLALASDHPRPRNDWWAGRRGSYHQRGQIKTPGGGLRQEVQICHKCIRVFFFGSKVFTEFSFHHTNILNFPQPNCVFLGRLIHKAVYQVRTENGQHPTKRALDEYKHHIESMILYSEVGLVRPPNSYPNYVVFLPQFFRTLKNFGCVCLGCGVHTVAFKGEYQGRVCGCMHASHAIPPITLPTRIGTLSSCFFKPTQIMYVPRRFIRSENLVPCGPLFGRYFLFLLMNRISLCRVGRDKLPIYKQPVAQR